MEAWLQETITVKDLLERHPHLLQKFIDMRLMCVGCPADAFHTLADVAKEYGLDQHELITELQKDIEAATGHHHKDFDDKA